MVPSGSGLVHIPGPGVSIDRSALPSASRKLRPIAMASPTLFIVVVRPGSAVGNFSKANRGTLTTTVGALFDCRIRQFAGAVTEIDVDRLHVPPQLVSDCLWIRNMLLRGPSDVPSA
ncbi:hypothetical protein GZL_01756 [Streptomyces sp. 769]|nr:hypothetical protein GZL_01756 [Streptomyces sp. 769]